MENLAADETDRALELTTRLLAEADQYPWKPAKYLASRLRSVHGLRISADTLEGALLEHAKQPERRIRYSFFPARKTLDLLWGHVANIGEFGALPDVLLQPDHELQAQLANMTTPDLAEDAPWCFLSHSFRDLATVLRLREELVGRGYGVWIAETEIQLGAMITDAVQSGLREADVLAVYLSNRSIVSRWVLKETGVAVHQWKLPPVVVIDGRSSELVELFAAWLKGADDWEAQVRDTMAALLDTDHFEQAATNVSQLVVGALAEVPSELRFVVAFPASPQRGASDFHTLDEAFPSPPSHREDTP